MTWVLRLMGGKFGVYFLGATGAVLLMVAAIAGVQTVRLGMANAALERAKERAEAAEAMVAAQREAAAVSAAVSARDAATDSQTQENRDAILAAPGARAPVDVGVDAAGRRALCLRHALQCTPQCVELLGACTR